MNLSELISSVMIYELLIHICTFSSSLPDASTPRNSRYTVRPDTEIDEEDEVEHQTRSDSDSARYVVVPESKASDPHTTPLTTFSRESSATVVAAELTDERELGQIKTLVYAMS